MASAQYVLRPIARFEDFAIQCAATLATAAEFGADLAVLPEFLTAQLLSIPAADGAAAPIRALPDFTGRYLALFAGLAARHRLRILAGTHVVAEGNRLLNAAHLFHPDGRVDRQPKLHLTPTETGPWGLSPGDRLDLVDLDGVKAAILVCYDVEFPELARQARARGADILLVPSCTDDRHGMHRVRFCAQARAIEDQAYVVVSGTVGSLPNVEWMRANVAQAAIFAPCDFPFPPGGVLAEGEVNHDMLVCADLDLAVLRRAREQGSVRTWQDRRGDLYPLAR